MSAKTTESNKPQTIFKPELNAITKWFKAE
jgi:hypothetical protein